MTDQVDRNDPVAARAQDLRNIKYRSAQAHRALDELNVNSATITANQWQGAISHAIHLLASGLEELTALVEKTAAEPEPRAVKTWAANLEPGVTELRIPECRTVFGTVVTCYRASDGEMLIDVIPDRSLTNAAELLLQFNHGPYDETILVNVVLP